MRVLRRALLGNEVSILVALATGETKPTKIMYLTRVDWVCMQIGLKHLINIDLVKDVYDPTKYSSHTYTLTTKGKDAAKAANTLLKLLS